MVTGTRAELVVVAVVTCAIAALDEGTPPALASGSPKVSALEPLPMAKAGPIRSDDQSGGVFPQKPLRFHSEGPKRFAVTLKKAPLISLAYRLSQSIEPSQIRVPHSLPSRQASATIRNNSPPTIRRVGLASLATICNGGNHTGEPL
jgi:hypothetical protein